MSDNLRRSSRQAYSCEVCGKRYSNQSGLDEHRLTHLKEEDNDVKLEHNSQIFTEKKKFVCGVCKKRFSSLPSFKHHMTSHSDEIIKCCHICQKSFSSTFALKQHLSTHMEEKQHLCDVCDKSFASLNKLKQHSICHAEVKQFSCDICHQTFAFKRSWLNHVEKKLCMVYNCNICSERFITISDLSVHKKTCIEMINNTILPKEEPKVEEICKVCGKSFINKFQLNEHECINVFVCAVCNESCPTQALLDKHNLVHSDKPFQCNLCPRTFPRRNDMISHLRRVHVNYTIYYNDSNVFVE